MSCTKPLDGYRVKGGSVTIVKRGDRPPRDATTRVPIPIPCAKCIGCKMEYARQWGIRCLHEAKMWPHNSYVTLTYADEFLPPGGSVCLRDVQLFMKRLRRARGAGPSNPIRYFLGAEYGEINGRPHYHCLLFNCGFGDLKYLGSNARGEPLYTSGELSSLWSADGKTMGHCSIGAVTYDSAVYCAKYALKKVTGAPAQEHYCVYDENGECYDRAPEFAIMSRRPGIGGSYCDKYASEIVAHDNVVINGKTVRPPRYYENRVSKLEEERMQVHRRRNKSVAVKNWRDNTPERLGVKERLMEIGAEKKERKL